MSTKLFIYPPFSDIMLNSDNGQFQERNLSSMINFKIGIMGAGHIAGTVADTIGKLDAFEVSAVASRSVVKAEEFAKAHNIETYYGSYEALASDPDVELIYIATPHAFHAEQAKMCLNAGKPVLVEKAFSYDAKTTEEVFKLAEEKHLFCGEAMWIRFMPIYKLLCTVIRDGMIGHVNHIAMSLGYDIKTKERIGEPSLAGGALLDLGVYPINVMSMIYGMAPKGVSSTCVKLNTGMDAQENLHFHFNQAQTADAFVTVMYDMDNRCFIYGDAGMIEVDNINNPKEFTVYTAKREVRLSAKIPETQISGYEYEFIAARDAIITGKTECPEITHAESVRIMKLMDSLREAWQIKFPMEA